MFHVEQLLLRHKTDKKRQIKTKNTKGTGRVEKNERRTNQRNNNTYIYQHVRTILINTPKSKKATQALTINKQIVVFFGKI